MQQRVRVQSPDKQRQAIAELATAADAKRTYCAQLQSRSIEHDKRMEMVVKVRLPSMYVVD